MGEKIDLHAVNPDPEKLTEYQNFESNIVDYAHFEDNQVARSEQKNAFMKDEAYLPKYDYPRLDGLYDDFMSGRMTPMGHEKKYDSLLDMKSGIYKVTQELHIAAEKGDENSARYAMYADFHEHKLNSILMLEDAQRLREDNNDVNRRAFTEANERLYGEYRQDLFEGIVDGSYEQIFDKETVSELGNIAREYFAAELSVVPDTDDTVYYGADEVSRIMNEALRANGLAETGWEAEVNPNKSGVSVNGTQRKLFLPTNTSRNAAEIKRLMVHEIGVHARRYENGMETGEFLLTNGTGDYLPAEEGLGVILECAIAGNFENASFDRAVERYLVAGYALGADGRGAKDARQTFEASWPKIAERLAGEGGNVDDEKGEARKRAFNHTENAFRGTDFYMQGMIYSKLKVYYEGLVDNMRYFAESGDMRTALDVAMLGEYDHTSEAERNQVAELVRL
ncbi:MAG: tyrosine/phenylalanine carboxypeptidase domain-containing protein [Candidatus Saccharimonadales bacterium]